MPKFKQPKKQIVHVGGAIGGAFRGAFSMFSHSPFNQNLTDTGYFLRLHPYQMHVKRDIKND